ncbi:hypothetical protein CWD77_04165 [Rhodohalobacter barkolensis]|uniref:Uncharacterized protein n=1 Tax=Rhodohalobacter barkolensis TaxID=2053187 RepID=A0A2N0VKE7_9BACT|nr:hypothetical protein CWD77_04165 [Rhodohalobacter barkolensis]
MRSAGINSQHEFSAEERGLVWSAILCLADYAEIVFQTVISVHFVLIQNEPKNQGGEKNGACCSSA